MPRHIYLAYTRGTDGTVKFLRVYGAYNRAFDWLWEIAQTHGVHVLPADSRKNWEDAQGPVVIVNAPHGQSWWLDRQQVH